MYRMPSEESWPINENLGSRFEGHIVRTNVGGLSVLDLLLSWRSAHEVLPNYVNRLKRISEATYDKQ